MTQSMKDLLLGLGFKPSSPAPSKEPGNRPGKNDAVSSRSARHHERPGRAGDDPATGSRRHGRASRPGQARPPAGPTAARDGNAFDLAKAYALRAQQEKDERAAAERLRQEAAQRKREAKAKVGQLLEGMIRNDAGAEIARHFEYNGKIRRIHVTSEQLKALNAGELAVVQLDGRYLLVDSAIAVQVHALLPSLIALRVDPNAPPTDDPYSDPKFAVPDDLVW